MERPDGSILPKIKISENHAKITNPHFKKVYRLYDNDTHKAITYPGAVCTDSKSAETAQAFLEWCMTDEDANQIWEKWGFELAQN